MPLAKTGASGEFCWGDKLIVMKVSIITAVFNREHFISDAIESLQNQTHPEIEHVVIDGASTDGTLELLRSRLDRNAVLVSEPDKGIYDALNKGLVRATGEIIGLLHSDDLFANNLVLADVAKVFNDPAIDAVYGDLQYVSKANTDNVIRHWVADEYSRNRLDWGWMPPHPALFLRRSVIEHWGGFDTRFRIAADYDAILRYFGKGAIRSAYIPRVLVKMRVGGESNRSIARVMRKSREDYRALKGNGVGGFGALVWKNVSKVGQFFRR
jgi:glycosyltransferase involved in cell wall biosynthesis